MTHAVITSRVIVLAGHICSRMGACIRPCKVTHFPSLAFASGTNTGMGINHSASIALRLYDDDGPAVYTLLQAASREICGPGHFRMRCVICSLQQRGKQARGQLRVCPDDDAGAGTCIILHLLHACTGRPSAMHLLSIPFQFLLEIIAANREG